ncbi:MAG: DUF1330 domain-containing protein [Rhodopila sp.]|nr:DUF1330 domain-containing protein [Rhodopila sp.]
MPAYLIANIEITDPAGFEDYRARVPAVVAQYGGRYVIRGNPATQMEGKPFFTRLTVLEFASMEALQLFYGSPEYVPLLAIRTACTKSDVVFVPGV